MKVTPTTKLIISTDYSKEWAYTLHQDMAYYVIGHDMANCEVWFAQKKLMSVIGQSIIIHAGYSFDGMTCYPDSSANLAAALLHDALYQSRLVPRKVADDMLRAVLRAQGQSDRFLVHLGVRLFGWLAFRHDPHIRIVKI